MEATGHYGVACVGQPDEKTAGLARKLGKRVANAGCRPLFEDKITSSRFPILLIFLYFSNWHKESSRH